jgi:hypothetical protein
LFSCAHEVGHQQFNHGTKADHYIEEGEARSGFVAEEYIANAFAGHLLMPRAAVLDAFGRRGWNAEAPTPHQAFTVANELGVGYVTLVRHMNVVMEILALNQCDAIAKIPAKTIKSELAGRVWAGPLTIADSAWRHSPIDVEIGEVVVLPAGSGDACNLLALEDEQMDRSVYTVARSGSERLDLGGGPLAIRASRKHYVGPLKNRYLEDPDEH